MAILAMRTKFIELESPITAIDRADSWDTDLKPDNRLILSTNGYVGKINLLSKSESVTFSLIQQDKTYFSLLNHLIFTYSSVEKYFSRLNQ